MANVVHCTVSNCGYWIEGNYCASSAILVTSGIPTRRGTGQPADKFGNNSPQLGETPIQDTEDSYCYTFVRTSVPETRLHSKP
ncbi:MAG: DUF1540 domain-containing protein [Chloroflexota bacterium]